MGTSPQLEQGYMRIANEVWEQVMMRDFTKRQRAILDLILRLSWGCQKKTARIPHQSDFELVGVGRTHIKKELEWLVAARVIFWDRDQMLFEFNKKHTEWKVSLVRGYDSDRLADLVAINLYGAEKSEPAEKAQLPKRDHDVTDSVTDEYQNGNMEHSIGYQNSNRGVTKTVTPTPVKPPSHAPFRPPKDNIKDNTIYLSNSEDPIVQSFHAQVGIAGPGQLNRLRFFTEELRMQPEVVAEAVAEYGRKFKEDPTTPFAYLESILRNWYNAGIRTPEDLYDHRRPRGKSARGDPEEDDFIARLDRVAKKVQAKEGTGS